MPPPDYNTRAAVMWQHIKTAVDFQGKTVVDLGCGSGDFLWRVWEAGASRVLGVDNNEVMLRRIRREFGGLGYMPPKTRIFVRNEDLNKWCREGERADIGISFSVLPYLDEPESFLACMADFYKTSLIEMQYWGDGPGMSIVQTDADMKDWLNNWWGIIDKIGFTRISGRNAVRAIWRCE